MREGRVRSEGRGVKGEGRGVRGEERGVRGGGEFSDPDKALGQSATPRWFLSVSVLSNGLYFTRGGLGPSRARSTGRASVLCVL